MAGFTTEIAEIPTDDLWKIGHRLRSAVKYQQQTDDEDIAECYDQMAEDFWAVQKELVRRGKLAPQATINFL